jgi:hypothetical protein
MGRVAVAISVTSFRGIRLYEVRESDPQLYLDLSETLKLFHGPRKIIEMKLIESCRSLAARILLAHEGLESVLSYKRESILGTPEGALQAGNSEATATDQANVVFFASEGAVPLEHRICPS